MTKKKSVFLLIVVSLLLAVLAVATFIRFPIGTSDYQSILGSIKLDSDIAGGTAYTLRLEEDNLEQVEDVNDVLKILRVRMDSLGYKSYTITALKDTTDGVEDYDIRIVARTTDSLASDIQAVSEYGKVTFYGGTSSSPTTIIMDEEEVIEDAVYYGEVEGTHYVTIKLTDYGNDTLLNNIETAENTYYLRVAINETNLLNSQIDATAINNKSIMIPFTGETAKEDATRMALQLKTGGLEYKYAIEYADTVSATLGENTGLYIVIAVGAMVLLAIIFFAIKYKGYGLIAGLSLVFFILVETAMLIAVPGVVLSMAGVLGIILATVLAVDGLIIIIKRVSEEFENGKTVKAAVKTGFKRSFLPILNTNVFAVIVGLLLIAFADGVIYGFAVTFAIGVAVSFITTVLIARMFTALILPLLKNPEKFLKLKRQGE